MASPDQGSNSRRWLILSVLVVSLFVVVLDNTVLNVALPQIQEQLGATQSQQEWIIDGFILAFAALLFPYGIVGDRWGRRLVLMLGLAVFGLASAASSYAATPQILIGTRVVMGVGGAAVLPATLAIITQVFPERERGRAVGVWAAASGVAVAVGPLIGGALLDGGFWWGSVFLINVPVVIVGLVGIALFVPESRDPRAQSTDVRGIGVAAVGLVLLVYGLIRAGETSEWTSPTVLTTMILGVVVLGAFVVLETRNRNAALDMTWFRNRTFSAAVAALTLVGFALFGLILFGSYYLQFDRGFRPFQAGCLLLPLAAGLAVMAPLSARLVNRLGLRWVCAGGLALVAAAFAAFYFIGHTTPIVWLEATLLLLGLGMGTALAPATTAVLNSVPTQRAGAGSAVNNTVRQVGGALGIAVLGSLLSTDYRAGLADKLSFLPEPYHTLLATGPAGESIGATQFAADRVAEQARAVGALPEVAITTLRERVGQAASDAFADGMHLITTVSGAVMVVAVLIALIFLPGRPARSR